MPCFLVALLWLAAPAMAAESELVMVSLDGSPRPGEVARIAVLAVADGRALSISDLVVTASCGDVVSRERLVDGTWRVRFRAPDEACPGGGAELELTADGLTRTERLPIAPAAAPTLTAPALVEAAAAQRKPVTFTVRRVGGDDLAASDLLVSAPEGEFTGLLATAGGVVVTWEPDVNNRFAHVVPIAVGDTRTPGSPISWVVVSLNARPTIPVRSEPKSEIRVRISNRNYGPAIADSTGAANINVETRPGDILAEINVVDLRGNTQKSQLALGGDPRPSLFAVAESSIVVGQPMPAVHVVALTADGRPWTGPAPTCLTGLGDALAPSPRGPGRWRLALPQLPAELFFDLRIDCTLDDRVRTTLRVPVESGLASRLVLRSYPPELAADVPIAQVQAHLENRAGDRLPADGITLTAGRGKLVVEEQGGAALQARYDGHTAVAGGSDVLTASWNLPQGAGGVWGLRVSAEAVDRPVPAEAGSGGVSTARALVVHGRALDHLGRPIEGVTLELSAGNATASAVTDARGWASTLFPQTTTVDLVGVEVHSPGRVHRGLLVGGTPVVTDGGGPGWPDLVATVEIPILSGRVRQVFIATDPAILQTSGSATAKVIVRLLDKSGNPVTDEAIDLTASQGVVTRPKRLTDGSFEATYAPPPGLPYGTFQITATGSDGSFSASTTLEVVPREVRRSSGVALGAVLGGNDLPRPWMCMEHDERLPWANNRVYVRVSAAFFTEHTVVRDDVGYEPVELSASVVPLGLGLLGRTERGRVTGWLGSSLEFAPYMLDARYGQTIGARGLGLASPGFAVYSGAGWRIRSGEAQLQLAYHFISMREPDVGWQGQLAGLVPTFGYKLIY